MFVNWELLILLGVLFISVTAQMLLLRIFFCASVELQAICFRKYLHLIDISDQPNNYISTQIDIFLTLPLSLMDPLPRMDIFTPVSSCNRFMEFPRGPSSFPTKLNCDTGEKKQSDTLSMPPICARSGGIMVKAGLYGKMFLKPFLFMCWMQKEFDPFGEKVNIKNACWPLVIYYQYNLTFCSPFIMWEKATMHPVINQYNWALYVAH